MPHSPAPLSARNAGVSPAGISPILVPAPPIPASATIRPATPPIAPGTEVTVGTHRLALTVQHTKDGFYESIHRYLIINGTRATYLSDSTDLEILPAFKDPDLLYLHWHGIDWERHPVECCASLQLSTGELLTEE